MKNVFWFVINVFVFFPLTEKGYYREAGPLSKVISCLPLVFSVKEMVLTDLYFLI